MEIKTTELRIGNLIYDDFNEIHIVEKIESKKFNDWNGSDPSLIVFSKPKDSNNNMYSCDTVTGIPLTEEILLNLGFELVNDSGDSKDYSIKGFDYYVGIDHEDIRIDFVTKSGCYCVFYDDERFQYVHQLQNLYFALTGKELNTSNLL